MSSFLIINKERGMLCLGANKLSLKEESILNIALNIISFNYIPNINSFILYNNYILCKLGV
jgi:hypothetical protein